MFLLWIIILPFLGFLISWLFNNIASFRRHHKHFLIKIPTIFIFINVILSIYIFYVFNFVPDYSGQGSSRSIVLFNWIKSGIFEIKWEFYFDNLTIIMLLVVNSISFFVHLYSMEYMSHDKNIIRFMSYISLFTFFMLILITGDNFVLLFLGWEGVGLCSYLLISFWYTRIQANKSAIKALIVNRISDFGLTIGLVIIYFVFKSLDFSTVFALTPFFKGKTILFLGINFDIIDIIAALLFFGACGKSAQIGLHTWLPDAMEGPTPVSALIHAATMVTAGVFLIIKCSPIFEYAPIILTIITFIGALTAFFSATAGLVQNDIKKVIAYSTCSQLGYMIFACGISNYHVSLFHLANHAFFKALLFLSAGAIIHSLSNEQDMRKFGGLMNLLPFTSTMLLIGSLSLMGFPFLTGFYSKDLILELAYSKYTISGTFCYWLGLITAFFTSFYSYRIFYLTFVYKINSYKKVAQHIHELPKNMGISLLALAFGSIFLGYVSKDLLVGLGTDFLNQSIFILPENNSQFNAEFIPHIYKILPFFSSMLAVTLVNFFFEYNVQWRLKEAYNLNAIYKLFIYKWYFDAIYNKFINIPMLDFAYNKLFKSVDKGILEFFGPWGVYALLLKLSLNVKFDQTGQIYRYVGYIFLFCFVQIIIFNFYFF